MMSLPEPPTIESLPEPPVMVVLPVVGVDDVVARAADDRIVARAAGDGRVAGGRVDEVVVVVERDVVAIGRADVLVELALEASPRRCWSRRSASGLTPVPRLMVIAWRGDREVERVGPAAADHEWVVAGVDLEHGVPRAAHERVVTAVGDERVVAGAADQAVGPRAGHEQVVARAADSVSSDRRADRARRDSCRGAGIDQVVRAGRPARSTWLARPPTAWS